MKDALDDPRPRLLLLERLFDADSRLLLEVELGRVPAELETLLVEERLFDTDS